MQERENFVNNHSFLFRPLANTENFPPDLPFITTDDVNQAVKKLRNTTPGPDGIQNIIWSKLSEKAFSLVAKFFSASFHFGYIPPRWKEAHVLMFPKAKKNPGDVNSYRPISLTNTISKLKQKIVTKFSTLIQSTLPSRQAGFRSGLEITDQLRVFTPIEIATKNRNFAAVIAALDVRKAFDRMWHDGLRLKLTQLNYPINAAFELQTSCDVYRSMGHHNCSFAGHHRAAKGLLSSSGYLLIARRYPENSKLRRSAILTTSIQVLLGERPYSCEIW